MNPDFIEIIFIIIRATVSIILLFILTKLMGKKQLTQLTFFDYCIGISIGSIAATFALDIDVNFLHPLIAMIVYALIAYLISFASRKSLLLRRLFNGKATLIMEKGKLYYDNMKKANMDINDFMTECRNLGYFNLEDIRFAVLETNGKISIMPKANKRPATPEDLNVTVKKESLVTTLIMDGVLLKANLTSTGKTKEWLMNVLKAHKCNSVKDVLFAGVDEDNKLTLYKYEKPSTKRSMFE